MIYRLRGGDTLLRTKNDHYGRRVRSHYAAYGTGYDFCSFYALQRENRDICVISIFYSSLTVAEICGESLLPGELEEIAMLVLLHRPQTLELCEKYSADIFSHISHMYVGIQRTEFAFKSTGVLPQLEVEECPPLDDVFKILKDSFPSLHDCYEIWLADTSHRVRRGLSQSFLMGDYTTATIQYIVDGVVLVGHVATRAECRGHFFARRLLYWLGERLSRDGFEVRLFARPHRVSYYEEIGFLQVGRDTVFELIMEEKV